MKRESIGFFGKEVLLGMVSQPQSDAGRQESDHEAEEVQAVLQG